MNVLSLRVYFDCRYSNSYDSSDSIKISYASINNVDLAAVSSMVNDLFDLLFVRFKVTYIFLAN